VGKTPLKGKEFSQTPMDYKLLQGGLQIWRLPNAEFFQKACSISKIKHPPGQKPSGKVGRTSLKGKEFSQTPMDYKSIELDYKLLQGDYKF
jgi:hypothetical protein